MHVLFIAAVLVGLPVTAIPQSSPASRFTGIWEGESKCTVANSPCHDEHALYRIYADTQETSRLKADGYKIISGSPEFMGTLTCTGKEDTSTLSCTANTSRHDDWIFHLEGSTLNGTLTLDNGATLYRKIALHRSSLSVPTKK